MPTLVSRSPQEISALYVQLPEEERFSVFSYIEFLINRRKKIELEQAVNDARTGQNLHGDFESGEDAVRSMLVD